MRVTDPAVGDRGRARRRRGRRASFDFTVAEPGWTMYMVSHFHYDPVWWNTQAAYTSVWTEDPPGRCRQTNGFDLVRAHLEMARREPDYKFVLAEVDYLKPYWDTHPEDRADLRRLIAEGRVEVMGGTYNEPNTNLTSPETTIRNFVHGIGFQRDVLGGDPATAWQLDVFGHDPQFPGMAADAGLTSSSWARGPYHQWGPMAGDGDPERMQFPSEFEWMAPSGRGLLTHYMPAHYAAGWWMDSAPTLAEAEAATYDLFAGAEEGRADPQRAAARRHRLHPAEQVGHRDPPRLERALHLAEVRLRAARASSSPPCGPNSTSAAAAVAADPRHEPDLHRQGRLVHRHQAGQPGRRERGARGRAVRRVRRVCSAGATYPHAALDKAWVQLAYGAHHDAITGSESDQVYLDLLTGWRDAWELGRTARDNALALLSSAVDGSVVVWNPLAHNRTDVVTVHLDEPFARHRPRRRRRRACRTLVEHDGHIDQLAGRATCRRWAGGPTGSAPAMSTSAGSRWTGNEIANEPTGCASTRPAAAGWPR